MESGHAFMHALRAFVTCITALCESLLWLCLSSVLLMLELPRMQIRPAEACFSLLLIAAGCWFWIMFGDAPVVRYLMTYSLVGLAAVMFCFSLKRPAAEPDNAS